MVYSTQIQFGFEPECNLHLIMMKIISVMKIAKKNDFKYMKNNDQPVNEKWPRRLLRYWIVPGLLVKFYSTIHITRDLFLGIVLLELYE